MKGFRKDYTHIPQKVTKADFFVRRLNDGWTWDRVDRQWDKYPELKPREIEPLSPKDWEVLKDYLRWVENEFKPTITAELCVKIFGPSKD